jgi:hypothetical protein
MKRDQQSEERKDEATDSRTLSDIETEEKVSDSESHHPAPSPDAGTGHVSGDGDAGDPM